MNLYEKLLNITADLKTVAKNLEVGAGTKSSYKAVSERDVLEAVKPLEAKYKVYSYPARRTVLESNMLETETNYGVKTTFMTRIETVYRFVNVEKPEEFIETTVFSEGIDAQDKGSGKAMTYADKYALLKAYKICTGEDLDAQKSEDVHYTMAGTKPFKETDPISKLQQDALLKKCDSAGIGIDKLLPLYKVTKVSDITIKQYTNIINNWEKVVEKCGN